MHSKVHFLVRSKVHNVFSGQFQHKRVLKRIAGSTPCSGGCLSTVTSPLGWRQRITLVPAATSTGQALRADCEFAITANCNARALSKHVGPPRAAWSRPQGPTGAAPPEPHAVSFDK